MRTVHRDGPRTTPNVETIPLELRLRDQWVVYTPIRRTGDPRPTKKPLNPRDGSPASTTDPATWGSFAQARAAHATGDYAGVGYVFSAADPYVGIDLDHCRDPETGVIEPWAAELLRD